MELVNYLRIVRRRWRVVTALVVVGLLLGLGSSYVLKSGPKGPGVTWYIARHTLVSSDNSANLQLAADLATDPFGEIPKRAAAKIGADNPASVVANVRATPKADVGLLLIEAVGTDPTRTAQVADAFAEELVVYLRDYGETQKTARLQAIDQTINDLETQFGQLQTQIDGAADDAQRKLYQSQQADIAKKLNDAKAQRTTVQNQPAPSQNLTTLSTAESLASSEADVQKLLATSSRTATKSADGPSSATASSSITSTGGLGPFARAALGGLAGLLAGVVLVIVLDRVDPRIRTKFEAEDAFGWPVIGEIPPLTRAERNAQAVLSWSEPRSRAAEAYRVLRSSLLFVSAGDDTADSDEHPIFAGTATSTTTSATSSGGAPLPASGASAVDDSTAPETRGQVIMVTSPNPSEGKTTTTANLAAILAETGRSVLVINCDFRRPRIHTFLGCEDVPRKVADTEMEGVKLVSQVLENPDEANPAEVVQLQRKVIRNARRMFDIVLLDTAPLLTTNDATEVLSVTDQVVVVARTGKTHKEAADRAAELLERRNAPVVGVVLNGATDVPTSRYYYYGDTPEKEEPEPGREERSPFDELVAPADDMPADDMPAGGASTGGSSADDDPTGSDPDGDAAPDSATTVTTEGVDDAEVTVAVGGEATERRAEDATPGDVDPGAGHPA